ncbi:YaaA family protein [Desertihabitans aurantiacus]|uniref:YaaA family protein n=1 Tax=Desertihabitans aurantiacus TaxID=2282477 RepID=UPI000DF7C97A|nr:peroxide stress protein YaaA [Desertihabitans aurantiacus]
MLVLLPPSESKHVRTRGRPMDLGSLSWPELTTTRERLLDALAEASSRPDAVELLKVSPGLGEEVARNTRLRTAPAVPVAELYTGVLYDALSLATLSSAGRRRATRTLVVASALHGALRLGDRVSPYRLSMSARLPGLGPLAACWRPVLGPVLDAAAGDGLVVDCRSGSYAAAWTPARTERWVRVEVPGATHLAKHTRGLVARALCEHPGRPRGAEQLADALAGEFTVALQRTAKGWALQVGR